MEEIKAPKKERKFLKAIGNIGKVLAEELVMGISRKFIGKVVDKIKFPKKRETLSILLLLSFTIAFAQFPNTGNKQRLGFQTTADGLVWRGALSDTAAIQPTTNQNAWLIIDTVNLKIYSFDFTSNVWGLVGGALGLTMPFDSITFNTAKDGTVGVGEVEYNDTQGSLIQGLKGGLVTNVIGQQLHQRVNNRTGATLAKGTAVYLSGSQGNRITVAKALATSDPTSANTFGIVAESIADNASGYIITEGLIMGINTSGLVEDSAVYLSPTVAGGLTSTKPQAPNHNVYIGVCVKSNAGSGELFVKIKNGLELDELHDVRITSPVANASLYYNGGLWRDTTAALLVSDTATMLANYATKAYADTSGRFYARQDFTNVSSATLTWTQSDTLVVGGVNVVQVYRNGQILLPTQYTIPTNASVVIGATAYKVGENYTVIFPRGGGAGLGGGGSGSLTSISGGTGITVSPNPITTTGTVSADLSVLMELTDTSLLNLNTRFASKLNAADTASLSNRINAKGTVSSVATGYGLSGGTITTTGTLVLDSATVFTRIRDSIVDVAIGNDTIKILKQEYPAQSSAILNWTVTSKFPIQLKAYILVFRNGQLLNNNQYNITDTAQITLVSTSFKSGANYTIATVSGIGSVGTGVYPNPVYPEAGIAVSTGTTWTTSIVNNSSNWNTAFTDRLKWDGGSTGLVASTGRTSLGGTTVGQSMFTLANPSSVTFPQFNSDNTVTALSANSFRSAIGAGVGSVTSVTVSSTSGNPLSISNTTSTPVIELLSATSARNGYLTSTDWTTFNNKQAQLNGTGFVKASGTSISYDNSTYLTTSSAASTYLPLTGGTITGDLSVNGTSTLKFTNIYGKNTYTPFNAGIGEQSISNVGSYLRGGTVMIFPDSNLVGSSANLFLANSNVVGVEYSAFGSGLRNYSKQGGDNRRNSFALYTSDIGQQNTNRLYINYNGDIGINDDTPSYKLDVNGTLNATGAATLSSTLAVTGNITEGGNNVLNNLDTVSLSNRINNKVSLTGDETITGTKTFTTGITTANLRLSNTISGTNYLIGYNNSGGAVGQVTVGSGLNLTSDVLTATNPTEKYYFNLGIVAGAADNSNATYDFTYGSNAFIVPTSLNGYCIDSVYIRAIGCSTCPPGAGEKDYYVGVYKATAGNNITTSGATLVGSQITMNEYDLNQVNRNDTLTTGDVWWVYLNGNYVSDLAYITAGFLVKKTCN